MCRRVLLLIALSSLVVLSRQARAQPAFEAYRAWLSTDAAKSIRTAIIRGDNAPEAQRVAAVLRDRDFAPTIIKRSELPTADLKPYDLLVILNDTQKGNWREPWGTDGEARAITESHKPILGIGGGGLGSFTRLDLPIKAGATLRSNSDSVTISQPRHAALKAPHEISPGPDGTVAAYTLSVVSQPANRMRFTSIVIPLCADPGTGRDYATILYQHPGAMYWGLEGPFSTITEAGKNLFENLAKWTVWAAAQNDPALLREGIVERVDAKRHGDRTIDLKLTRADGALAPNQSFVLEVNDPTSTKGWIEFAKARTDADGKATLGELTGGPEGEKYRISVPGTLVPAASFSLTGNELHRQVPGRIPPRLGEHAPDLDLRDVLTGAPVKLSSFRGKVVFLDFWATWCAPCQEPMRHNYETMKEVAAYWADRAVIVGVSTDAEISKAKQHITAKGWTNFPQLWVPVEGGKPIVSSEFAYGFNAIPTAFLIDQQGIIRWRGHPDGYETAIEIEKLLNREPKH